MPPEPEPEPELDPPAPVPDPEPVAALLSAFLSPLKSGCERVGAPGFEFGLKTFLFWRMSAYFSASVFGFDGALVSDFLGGAFVTAGFFTSAFFGG